nr:MAG TPA: hypothetical protein [Caudoviricetes sp.]
MTAHNNKLPDRTNQHRALAVAYESHKESKLRNRIAKNTKEHNRLKQNKTA